MNALPTPADLAQLVGEAAAMLYRAPIDFGGECPPSLPNVAEGHTVVVPLIGGPLYIVAAKASTRGGEALASMMFECPLAEVTAEMVDDSLRELVNILAGQVKGVLAREHQLGLPSRLDDDNTLMGSSRWAGARLRIGEDSGEIDVAVAEFA